MMPSKLSCRKSQAYAKPGRFVPNINAALDDSCLDLNVALLIMPGYLMSDQAKSNGVLR